MKLGLFVVFAGVFILMVLRINAREIGFIEDFALADDRSKVLEQLIPGTEDYYFYHCLHAQNTGDYKSVRKLTGEWIKQHGYTHRLKEIQNRQALLEYQKNPVKSLEYIKRDLGLRFDHQKEAEKHKAEHDAKIDSGLTNTPDLIRKAFSRYSDLTGFENKGLFLLQPDRLEPDRRRDFLNRIEWPDFPQLPKIVVEDLKYKNSGGFGSHDIHYDLLKPQMDECARLFPEILDDTEFINTCIRKLAPRDNIDLEHNPAEKEAYLKRLWAFVRKLPVAHNSLKAHVLQQLLAHYRSRGAYDGEAADLFMEYLAIPKDAAYVKREPAVYQPDLADLDEAFQDVVHLPPITSEEEALIKDYLMHYLADAKDYRAFVKHIRDDYLKSVFVETKIVSGAGDSNQWFAMISPERYQALKDRVDIEFAPTNKRFYKTGETVTLELFLKNVNTLIVKIFELNTYNYYVSNEREIDVRIDLDGLAATREKVVKYDDSPFKRSRRVFEFPNLNKNGVFVIEFIGNGKSSRAVVQKGRLHLLETIGPAGHEFTILDDSNNPRPGAVMILSGREFKPNSDGRIVVPFTTDPELVTVVLKDDSFCSLDSFEHMEESYELFAGFYVDRESLIKDARAAAALRPSLAINGRPVSVDLLDDVRVRIQSRNFDDVISVKEIPNVELHEDRETMIEFPVPENLIDISFTLMCKIKNMSLNKTEDLSDSMHFLFNQHHASLSVQDLFSSRSGDAYILHLLGKNGEPLAGRLIRAELKHAFFRDKIYTTLRTDKDGRVDLGNLENIDRVRASCEDKAEHTILPENDNNNEYPAVIYGIAGKAVCIPYNGRITDNPRRKYALFETRRHTPVADMAGAVKVEKGRLEISGLAPGRYVLLLKENRKEIEIRIQEGRIRGGWIVSDQSVSALNFDDPVYIEDVDISPDKLVVKLGNADDFTRLHVFGGAFLQVFDPDECLESPELIEVFHKIAPVPESFYVAGRDIGDEYRYILERQYAEKFPGNMLERPGLLLNPWSIGKTATSRQDAAAGGDYDRMQASAPHSDMDMFAEADSLHPFSSPDTAGRVMDFLKYPAVVVLNLRADDKGCVEIDRKQFKNHPHIRLLAIKPLNTAFDRVILEEGAGVETRDLRMAHELPTDGAFTEQKRISTLNEGETLRIENIATSDMEIYDSVQKVYQLLSVIGADETFEDFRFIVKWKNMTGDEKLASYSKYACHELNFFLYHKDREFFDQVISPYIADKKDKTFMDRWLLGADLSSYAAPSEFMRLNIAEQILFARRSGKSGWITRYVKDLFDLAPPDAEQYNRLFNMALSGRDFDEDTLGFQAEKKGMLMQAPPASPRLEQYDELEDGAEGLQYDDFNESEMSPDSDEDFAEEIKSKAKRAKKKGRRKYFAGRAEERKTIPQFFRQTDKTEEWAENNYYKRLIEDQTADLITVNRFWLDLANHESDVPFITGNFIYAVKNVSEMMMAMALLDLPFEPASHETAISGYEFTVKAAGPAIVFHKEIKSAPVSEQSSHLIVARNYFRSDDRYRYENNERYDKSVEDEFLIHKPYGCRVVVSNPTSSKQKLSLLLQIPKGAVPLNNGFYTRAVPIAIEPFATRAHEYHFYFPKVGNFPHFPAQAALAEKFAAGSAFNMLKVAAEPTRVDSESWEYISQHGKDDEVLAFLDAANLNRLDLDKVAFRYRNRAFFNEMTAKCRERRHYDHTLWSYAVYHNIPPMIDDYLKQTRFADRCGMAVKTPLLDIDPVRRGEYQHLEYAPLVNARAHCLGKRRTVLNDKFYGQYHQFMQYLSYFQEISNENLMSLTYYMILQDRVGEALGYFNRIDVRKNHMILQYDYIQLYLDFYTGNLKRARSIVKKYESHPVVKWRKRFQKAADFIIELEGAAPMGTADQEQDGTRVDPAETEPGFSFKIESRKITISYHNLKSCVIHYYPMNIELLFSRNPFVRRDTDHFSYILPNMSARINLPPGELPLTLELPKKFHNSNLMVEIEAGGMKKSEIYYANSLKAALFANYGQVFVTHQTSGKPIPETYVKTYARFKDGTVRFFKDGYTDLRGKFDYASLNTDDLDHVDRFAILILNKEFGAVIREAAPPKR